jgi:hypothetical protein
MKNRLKLAVTAVALVAVGLLAVHPHPEAGPSAGSSASAVEAAGLLPPRIRVGIPWLDDLIESLAKTFRPRRPPVPEIRPVAPMFEELVRLRGQQLTTRIEQATWWLPSDQRTKVVAQVCKVKQVLETEGTSSEALKARLAEANETIGHLLGGWEAFQKISEAFAQHRDDRYEVAAVELTCLTAELGSS